MGDRLAGKVCDRDRRGLGDRPATGDPLRRGGRARHLPSTSTATPSRRPRATIGAAAFAVAADVSVAAEVQAYTDATVDRWGGLHVVFNNAGVNIPGVFHEATDEVIDRTLNVNVKGCIYGCRYAIPHMLARRRRIADQHELGQRPRRRALPRDLRHLEGRDRDAVARASPSTTRNRASAATRSPRAGSTRRSTTPTPRCSAGWRGVCHHRLLPADRPARRTREIANVALFLASDESSFVTGSVLVADGGMTAK